MSLLLAWLSFWDLKASDILVCLLNLLLVGFSPSLTSDSTLLVQGGLTPSSYAPITLSLDILRLLPPAEAGLAYCGRYADNTRCHTLAHRSALVWKLSWASVALHVR